MLRLVTLGNVICESSERQVSALRKSVRNIVIAALLLVLLTAITGLAWNTKLSAADRQLVPIAFDLHEEQAKRVRGALAHKHHLVGRIPARAYSVTQYENSGYTLWVAESYIVQAATILSGTGVAESRNGIPRPPTHTLAEEIRFEGIVYQSLINAIPDIADEQTRWVVLTALSRCFSREFDSLDNISITFDHRIDSFVFGTLLTFSVQPDFQTLEKVETILREQLRANIEESTLDGYGITVYGSLDW